MNYYFINPFNAPEEHGPHQWHRRPHRHHPYGFDGRQNGPFQPPFFGPLHFGHQNEWSHFGGERHRHMPPGFFESFGGRGRGGFGPQRGGGFGFFHGRREGFGPLGFFGHGHGWGFQPEDYSSSDSSEEKEENGNAKKAEEIILSEGNSDIEYLGQEVGQHPKGRCQRGGCGKNKEGGCHRRRCGRGRGRPGCGPRHFRRGRRCPWNPKSDDETSETEIPIEETSAEDFQDVTAEISNLQLQPDDQQENPKSNKKSCKVALSADGFKAKDIRIRRNLNKLLIEGKQNAINQLGTFQRSMTYTITIPAEIDPTKIKVKLGVDGFLWIKTKKLARNENVEKEAILIED